MDQGTNQKEQKQGISKYTYLMLLGHATTDIAQGSLPAILAFLIDAHGYTLASAAGFVFAGNLISAITQPIFGHLGDKVSRPWFMIAGILMAAAGISLIGFLDSYVMTCVCAIIVGIGVSLFHPEGSKLANIAAGERKGVGMSVFSVGGNIGFTGGPLIATAAILIFGLKGTAIFMIPAIVTSLLLLPRLKEFKRLGEDFKASLKEETPERKAVAEDNVKGFTMVAIVTFFRATCASCLNIFIPLFFIRVFMTSVAAGNINLSIYAAAGIVATLAGGRIADRFGYRPLYRVCCAVVPPLLFFFAFNREPIFATIAIIFISIFISASHSALMVTGQGFLPTRIGMASGILFGLTISMGGIVAPFIGKIGDNFGLVPAMIVIACISVGGLVTVFFIPKHKDVGRRSFATGDQTNGK
ncbi:MAG: MFS transporter [Clostridiales Family XIII bacterium]|jgi:FSR family fosmidomycin resistance protein-like MFS transporter|nr:MFS transporter [Clostridiales Family XIII bacterium]